MLKFVLQQQPKQKFLKRNTYNMISAWQAAMTSKFTKLLSYHLIFVLLRSKDYKSLRS